MYMATSYSCTALQPDHLFSEQMNLIYIASLLLNIILIIFQYLEVRYTLNHVRDGRTKCAMAESDHRALKAGDIIEDVSVFV